MYHHLDNWRAVIHTALSFIALIGEHPLDQQVIDDAIRVSKIATMYPDVDPIVSMGRLSERLWQPHPRGSVIVSPYQCSAGSSGYTSAQFLSWFSQFMHPSKVRVILSGKPEWIDLDQPSPQDWNTFPGYGVKYFITTLNNPSSHHRYTAGQAQQEGLRLPEPNEFVPRNVDLLVSSDHMVRRSPTSNPSFVDDFGAAFEWLRTSPGLPDEI